MIRRTLAIGDIHGCFQALAALLDAVQPTAEDCVVVLGDCVDRGPDSRAVVARLLELQRHTQLVLLQGNHELMMLEALGDESARDFWLNFGGQPTLASYGGQLSEIPEEHLEFIRGARPYHQSPTHLFLHANYQADLPMEDQPEVVRLWTHLDAQVPPPHCSGKIVIVGHTPQVRGEILDLGHLICIDTFCYGGGWLTALDVDSRQTWQASEGGRLRSQPSP